MIRKITKSLIGSLFPGQCLCCGLPSATRIDLCTGCAGDMQALTGQCLHCAEPLPLTAICPQCLKKPPAFDRVICPYIYAAPLDQIIKRLKHGDLSAGNVLGNLLANHILSLELPLPDYLVAMPLHWRRRFSRGFNQAHEIARVISGATGVAVHNNLVRRVANTQTQQNQGRHDRQRNLRAAFAASTACQGLHIAVIDDVVTTTSTARAAAEALKSAGASNVEIWCAARTALEK